MSSSSSFTVTLMLVLTLALALAAAVLLLRHRPKEEEVEVEGWVGLTKMGRGVFADNAYSVGDVVESCPLIVAPSGDWGEALQDYVFQSSEDESALALGLCSLYNHSDDPNVEYDVDRATNSMVVTATRPIAPGDQMFISYGSGWWSSRGLKPSTS